MAINLPIVSKYDDKGAKEAQSSLSKLGDKVAGVGKAAVIAAGVAGVGALTVALTKGFGRLVDIDNATAKLRGLGNSAEDVASIMDSALASVKGTSFGLGEAANIAANAVAAGIKPGQELTRYLTLTADAAAIAGVSLDEMGNTMNTVRTIGAAYNDSLQILAQKGIPIYTMLADELGITTEAVKTLASEGGISADLFEKVMEEKFGGAALAAGDTVEGSFKNMEAALGRLGAALLGTTFEALPETLGKITEGIDSLVPFFQNAASVLGDVFGAIGDTWNHFVVVPFQKFVDEHGPAIKKVFDEVIKPAFEMFVNNVLPVFLAAMGFLATLISDNVIATLENLAEWFTDPANKNTIIFFTGLVAAMVAQFMLIPIIITAAIVAITTLLNFLSMALTKTREYLGVAAIVGPTSRAVSGSSIQAQRIPGRAAGGGAANTGLSWVGEKGPELITMPRGATVTPIPQHMRADALMGSNSGSGGSQGGNYITINVNGGLDSSAQIGEAVVNAIRKYERTSGAVFARA